VCGAPPVACHPRGAACDRPGPSVGRALGQTRWGVDVGHAGGVRAGDGHGVSHPPPRDGHNHVLREVATPVRDLDRQTKVKRRRTVRGLRTIERRVLEDRRHTAALEPSPAPGPPQTDAPPPIALPEAAASEACARSDLGAGQTANALDTTAWAVTGDPDVKDEAGEVVLGYCAAVRGRLNDAPGGPLHPPGGGMREAFQEGRASLDRHLAAHKGGVQRRG
jgi:hypothetical protein